MSQPVLLIVGTPGDGEVILDVSSLQGGEQVRLYYFIETPIGTTAHAAWPDLLGYGRHTITGLTAGEVYGFYAVQEDPMNGDTLSWPSNLVKMQPTSQILYDVQLRRELVEAYTVYGVKAYRLQISAVGTTNLPVDIFLYEKVPPRGGVGTQLDSFVTVCSPADLEQFPAGFPEEGQDPPYYRMSAIDVVLARLEEVDQFWDDVRSATLALQISMGELDNLFYTADYAAWADGSLPEPSLSSVSLQSSSEVAISSSSSLVPVSSSSSSIAPVSSSSSSMVP